MKNKKEKFKIIIPKSVKLLMIVALIGIIALIIITNVYIKDKCKIEKLVMTEQYVGKYLNECNNCLVQTFTNPTSGKVTTYYYKTENKTLDIDNGDIVNMRLCKIDGKWLVRGVAKIK